MESEWGRKDLMDGMRIHQERILSQDHNNSSLGWQEFHRTCSKRRRWTHNVWRSRYKKIVIAMADASLEDTVLLVNIHLRLGYV